MVPVILAWMQLGLCCPYIWSSIGFAGLHAALAPPLVASLKIKERGELVGVVLGPIWGLLQRASF